MTGGRKRYGTGGVRPGRMGKAARQGVRLPSGPLEVEEKDLAWGVGAVTLDCEMARLHGWTERDINAAAKQLARISRFYGNRARRRHPEWYEEERPGVTVFVGKGKP